MRHWKTHPLERCPTAVSTRTEELICQELKDENWADISRAYLIASSGEYSGLLGLVKRANGGDETGDTRVQTPKNDYFFITPIAAAEGLDLDMDGRPDGTLNVGAFYSVDALDKEEETYLQSFFLERFMADEHDHCEQVGHNVMCNSISSLDDPDDYCREIGPWIEEHNLTVLARQTLDAGLEPNDERLLTPTTELIRDYEPGQADCGFLNMLDTVVDRINDILDLETPVPYYQPTGYRPSDFVLLRGTDADGIGADDIRRQAYEEDCPQ